jgi:hypothetical protein
LFDEHKEDEAIYTKKLKTCREPYLEFKYGSSFIILEDNFNTLEFNQYEIGPNGKA